MPRRIIVTGGAGFIGSNLVRHLLAAGHRVLNLDKLTYAGNLQSLSDLADNSRYAFAQVDIVDTEAVRGAFADFRPDAVMHLAAESHVDRSIDGPRAFIETNVVGTMNMLEASLEYWRELDAAARDRFRFLHVSTDEVYGSLGDSGYFTESTRYDPHSPYSASKAASDHLVRAWHDTYGLPVLVTNCSNNYGPYQFPEKLIPVVILKCLRGEPIPIYGKGENVRDWLYVEDHCAALATVLERGRTGETYNIGGNNERTNLELVQTLCQILDRLRPCSSLAPLGERVRERGSQENNSRNDTAPLHPSNSPLARLRERDGVRVSQEETSRSESNSSLAPSGERVRERGPQHETSQSDTDLLHPSLFTLHYSDLITFVADRPGHDLRYAIDASKIKTDLGWEPRADHEAAVEQTVRWYLENEAWWQEILSGEYRMQRLGAPPVEPFPEPAIPSAATR